MNKSDVHWVTPKLLAEVGFTEWTDDNKLRHPRFLGLRYDKKPEHVYKLSIMNIGPHSIDIKNQDKLFFQTLVLPRAI